MIINQNLFNYKKNRLQQIKGFYYAVRLNGISQAAKSLGLTQSTVTLQIQSLERDMGFKLFKRDSKPLSLTEEGEDFYKTACPMVQEFESVVEKFLNLRKEKEKTSLNIAVHHIAINYLMPQVIADFKKNNPEIKITIKNIPLDDATKKVKNGEIDLAFYPVAKHDPEIKYTKTVAYDPILIINKDHPLAKKDLDSLKDLKNFDLIRVDKSLVTLPLFEEVIENFKIKGSVDLENGNWDMLKSFVKKGDFVAVISEMCIDKSDNDLEVKNLSKFFPKMKYFVMQKNGVLEDKRVGSFLDSMNRCFAV